MSQANVKVEEFVRAMDTIADRRAETPASDTDRVIRVRGELSIARIFPGGEKELLVEKSNLIVNQGFTILAYVWGGPSTPESYATLQPGKIGVGTSLVAADVNQTDLQGAIAGARFAFTGKSFLGTPVNGVQFDMLIPQTEPLTLGADLKEAGLFSVNSASTSGMIARQVHTTITKTSAFQLLYSWKFTFTV